MSPHAAQAKNAGNDASPFAMLMDAGAPKAREPDDNSSRNVADDKSAGAKPAQTDAKAAPRPADKNTRAPEEKAVATGTPARDATVGVIAANDAAADDVAVPADAQPLPMDPVLIAPPQPVASPVVAIASPIMPSANDGSADMENAKDENAKDEVTAPVVQPLPQAAAKPAEDAAPQAPQSQAAQADAGPQVDAPKAVASQSVPQTDTPGEFQAAAALPDAVPTTLMTAPQESVQQEARPLVAVSQIAATGAPAKPIASTNLPAPEAPKNGAALTTPDTAGPQTATAESAGGNGDSIAADASKPDFTPAADIGAPKAAPQAQAAANINMATPGIAGAQPQTVATAAIPEIAQHVQVAPEAAKPNVAALAVEISAKSQSGARQFDIRLDPPELGRVEVRLSIDAAGKASAHLSADQPQTLDLLQKDSASLTRALRDAGLDVSQNSLNFSLRHQNHDGAAHRSHARGTSRALTATNSIEATPVSASWRGDGRLDIRV